MGLRTAGQLANSKQQSKLAQAPEMTEVYLEPEKSSYPTRAFGSPERPERAGATRALLQLSVLASLALLSALALLLTLLLATPAPPDPSHRPPQERGRQQPQMCSIELVESLPIGLHYNSSALNHQSTYQSWKRLLDLATESVDIASYYWSLLGKDVVPDPSDAQGEDIYRLLSETGLRDDVTLSIVENGENGDLATNETTHLELIGAAQVRRLNFTQLVGAGILHTKMWLVDGLHFYVGSANMDYRSLTQVKELGALISNCSALAADMNKIFQTYWLVGGSGRVPSVWPHSLHTDINQQRPLTVQLPRETALVYLASSPPQLCPPGRTSDGAAIVHSIDLARKFVYVAVMDYYPMLIYGQFTFWPVIDDALRRAAVTRGVEVRLLASHWNHTRQDMLHGLRSLQALDATRSHVRITVRMFVVPPYSGQQIPFSRVNHNKYMVTDQVAYIGTSNWSGDYFVNTGGIGLVVNSTQPESTDSVRSQLEAVFLRDWESEHARPLAEFA